MKHIGLYFSLVGLVALTAYAHSPGVTIDRIGGITVIPGVDTPIVVPHLPFTIFIDGTVVHDGEGNLNTLELWAIDNGSYFYGPSQYFKGAGGLTSSSYSIPWTIESAGFHALTIDAGHERGSGSNCPAAPALANAYLKENELGKKNSAGKNIISAVAHETGMNGSLWAREKCSSTYGPATISFVVELLDEE